MRTKIISVVLAVVCIGLLIGLIVVKNQGDDQHTQDVNKISDFSNEVVSASQQVDSLKQVNLSLTNDLAASRQMVDDFSNSLAAANEALSSTRFSMTNMQEQVSTLTNQVATLNTQIADLESQNHVLDQHANDLTNQIAQLNAQIETTENKLAIATTNNAFLASELQKQLAEKAELERKFNDLDEVRAQVKKLKTELFVTRRLELDRYTNGTKKGGQLLMQRTPLSPPPQNKSNYNLNVEVGSDGSVKIIPPLDKTNAPAH